MEMIPKFVTSLSVIFQSSILPSVLWRCWLGGKKGIRPVKNRVVGCWCGCLFGARCRLAYGPADATATHCLLLQTKTRLVLSFWYWLTWVVPEKGLLNGCVVCVFPVCHFLDPEILLLLCPSFSGLSNSSLSVFFVCHFHAMHFQRPRLLAHLCSSRIFELWLLIPPSAHSFLSIFVHVKNVLRMFRLWLKKLVGCIAMCSVRCGLSLQL